MTQISPTWFQVARRPKWVGALAIALAIAAVCALLAGWQASRSVDQVVPAAVQKAPVALASVLKAGEPATEFAVGTQVRVAATLNPAATWVVANRVQRDGTAGYWLVGDFRTATGVHIFATLGFSTDAATALDSVKQLRASGAAGRPELITGRLSQSEPPQVTHGAVLGSLSLAQLVNLLPEQEVQSYPLFILRTKHDNLAPELSDITVAPIPTEAQINFLSAFYTLEWIFFCGFSVYIWWRLVRDAQLIEAGLAAPRVKRSAR